MPVLTVPKARTALQHRFGALCPLHHSPLDNRFAGAHGPGITLPIFSGGKIRANIAAQDARLDQAIARYEGAMLNALRDVEGSLAAYDREQQRREHLMTAADASRTAKELANELYTRGLSDFLSVLDAERAQYAAEDDLVPSQTVVATNLVSLYKALGGGW